MSQPEPLVRRFNLTSLLRNRQANAPVISESKSKELQNFMKTWFAAVTGYPGARSQFLGRLAWIAFVSGSTISLSFAGFRDGGVRGSGGSFAGPVQHIGFTASHGNVDAHNPYLSGSRGGAMGYSEYRGSLASPNHETVGSRNGFVPSPASQIGTIRPQEAIPKNRNLNPPAAARPIGAPAQGPQRGSAETNARRSEIGSQHLSANPAASDERARINGKFQRYENKFASDRWMSDGRIEPLNRARVFLLNLIDLGYAPLMVDNWCDALLNDQIDDGMPMDLVDAYWGQPVETQEFVEYYVPYEVCTYRTAEGDYRQVTYKNGVVSRPTSNVADVRIR
jgi:hypothetical protein